MVSNLAEKVVRITLDSSGLPVPDANRIEVKRDNQKVRWCADFEFSIEFEGYSDVQPGTGGPDGRFAWKSGKFTEIRTYKYSIIANGQTNDPEVDVRP